MPRNAHIRPDHRLDLAHDAGIAVKLSDQLTLFSPPLDAPDGLLYRPDFISQTEEASLVTAFQALPFKPFEFQGYLGKRQVVSFGWKYDYQARKAERSAPMPPFILELRQRAAQFAGLGANDLEQLLINQYAPGAGIGWHKDKGAFTDVLGVSLLSSCGLRFRRKQNEGWERKTLTVQPRSIYLLRGPARSVWEHSIAAHDDLRYSVTFRTLASAS